MAKTSEHLEQAEHFHHASLTLFDRRVAMTMAIVAAALAFASMLREMAGSESLRTHVRANA